MSDELKHYGILGMRWGIRRNRKELDRLSGRDKKFVQKRAPKITAKAHKSIKEQMREFERREMIGQSPYNRSGQLSMTYVNQYNRKLAQLMNEQVKDIQAPSGKVLRYVAKRGEIGVHTALADQGYNMDKVRSGVYGSGRVAYKQEVLRKA